MKRTTRLLSLLTAVIMALTLVPAAGGAAGARPLTAREREVKIAELAEFASAFAEITRVYDKDLSSKKAGGDFALCRIIVKSAHEINDEKAVASASGYNGWHVFQYDSPEEARAALNRFKGMKKVEWAEPDGIMSVCAEPGSSSFRSWGYGAGHINMYQYNEWLYSMYGSVESMPQVVVAVIDTGVDSDHPFLAGRLVRGWNFIDNNSNPEDGHSHGTHVSGTVVDGTFANVKIMPVKVLSDSGSGSNLGVALGIEYAYLHGAKVENMSLGGGCDEGGDHYLMAEAVGNAFDNGCTVVVAAGNESTDASASCPANIERVCTVASIDSSHRLSYFSNYGPLVDVAAPGENISSSVPGGGYGSKDGTSMASPHVAAVAAQIKTANPDMDADEVVSAIKGAAMNINLTNAGTGMAHLAPELFGLNAAVNAADSHYHFVTSGNYVWTVEDGCAVSGNAGAQRSASVMKTELTVGHGQTVTFDYKISSEEGRDFLRVKANGETLFEVSGERDWTSQTVELPSAGSVALTFEYSKDVSGDQGSDRAWVRNFSLGRSLSSAVNISGGAVEFASSGAYPWTVNAAENAAMSGNAGVDGSASVMTASVELKKGMMIAFSCKVSADEGDRFVFKVNGSAALTSGATEGYEDFVYSAPYSGVHALEFAFEKDGSGSAGEDCALVKAFFCYHSFESAACAGDVLLPFVNDAEYPWYPMQDYITSGNWYEGGTTSYFTLQLPMHAGETLSFRYRTSSVSGYDYFRFYVDGVKKTQSTGETAWNTYTFTATAEKTYTFKWAYEKDSFDMSQWYGVDDAAYVDDIAYSGTLGGLLGDVDGSGEVNANDALLILRYALGIIPESALDLSVADVDGSGTVDANDALLVLRCALGIIASF